MTRIGIIGAGLAGRMLALNLLRQASPADRIMVFDRRDSRYMGPAYSGEADHLLLNVPACKMGADSQDPEHFLKWVHKNGIQAGRLDFLPRRLYRDYVLDLLQGAQQKRQDGSAVEYLQAEISDIQAIQEGVRLYSPGKEPFLVDKAVLAVGNFPPRHPQIRNPKALESKRYVQNPWTPGLFDQLAPEESVVIIGTGQTTVDLLVALHQRDHVGKIVAVSRRALLPLAHGEFEQYPSFYEEFQDSKKILEIFRAVRKHLNKAEEQGIDPRAVIDSLRPNTQALWYSLPDEEKRRFLRHIFRYWEVIRSRIPPESQTVIDELRRSGQLQILQGRIRNLVENETGIEVCYTPHGGSGDETLHAGVVINCMGPESDFEKIDHPLVKNLIRRGLIRPGPAQLGIDAQTDGAIIGRDGSTSTVFFTLGSTMRGVLWEVIAAPEICAQAERLADLLLDA